MDSSLPKTGWPPQGAPFWAVAPLSGQGLRARAQGSFLHRPRPWGGFLTHDEVCLGRIFLDPGHKVGERKVIVSRLNYQLRVLDPGFQGSGRTS